MGHGWTQTAQTPRTLTVVTALPPAVADFRSQAPLSRDLWPHSPLRRLPHIVPAPRSVKPAGHRGSRAFLEGLLWTQTLGQAAHTGQSAEHCLGFPVPPNSPSQAGEVTVGRLVGSWLWSPCGSSVMLGCQDQLGLTGCCARLPEALRKDLCLGFCWEAQESEGCSMRRLPGSRGRAGRGLWAQPCCPWWRAWCRNPGSARLRGSSACPSAAALPQGAA